MSTTQTPLPLADARQTLQFLGRLLRPHWLLCALALVLCLLAAAAGLVAPWVVGLVVDAVQRGSRSADLIPLAALLLGAGTGAALLTTAGSAAVARLGQLLLARLREAAMDNALALPLESIEESGHGDVLSRLGDDVAVIGRGITTLLGPLVGALLAVLLTVAGLAALHPLLALAGLCALPVYWLALRWYLPRAAPRYAHERTLFARRAEVVVSALHGSPTIGAYQAEEDFTGRIRHSSEEARACSAEILWFYTGWSKWLNFAELTGLGMIILSGYFLVNGHATTTGAVTAAALLFHRLFNPIGLIISSFDQVQSTAASLSRVVGLAEARQGEPGEPDPGEKPRRSPPPGSIVVDRLSHRRGSRDVLRDLDVKIAPGERVALVGPSGAGKSTLAAIIAQTLAPTSGRVLLGETKPGNGEDSPRAGIVLLTQDGHVFSGPLEQDLLLAREGASQKDLEQALEAVEALEWVRNLPQGLQTIVGDGGHQLTTEQTAQIALARVWLADPHVLILDEASAESTSRHGGVLDRASEMVLSGRTGLVVAHRLTQAKTADRILVMDQGRIVETGTHADLLAAEGRYAQLWSAWMDSSPSTRAATPTLQHNT